MADFDIAPDEAHAILVEAKANNVYEGVIPDDEKAKLAAAEELVEVAIIEAQSSYGNRDPAVQSVLGLARIAVNDDDSWDQSRGDKTQKFQAGEEDYEPAPDPENKPQPEEELDEQLDNAVERDEDSQPEKEDPDEPKPDKNLDAFEQKSLGEARARKLRLPIPQELPEGEKPEMPFDLTDLTDEVLMKLHSKFNACLGLTNWELGKLVVDEKSYRDIADYHALMNRRKVDRDDPDSGKKKTVADFERDLKDVESADNVLEWRDKQHRAGYARENFERLVKIYEKNVDVISRQWAYREKILESSGNKR